MDVRDGADELGEDPLDFGRFEGAVFEEVVVQFVACVWSDIAAKSRVQCLLPGQYSKTSQTSSSVTMTSYSLAMCGCMNWRWWWISRARFASSFLADLSTTWATSAMCVCAGAAREGTYPGAIGELVGGQIDLPETALADQPSEGVVADVLQVRGGEFTGCRASVSGVAQGGGGRGRRGGLWVLGRGLTRGAACTSLQVASRVSKQAWKRRHAAQVGGGAPSSAGPALQPERGCSTASKSW